MSAKEKVLIVDDAEINRAVLVEALGGDYETIEAQSGKEALKILEDHPNEIRVVLLDVMMPDMSGYDVLRYMRFNDMLKGITVLMITAEASQEAEEQGLSLGAIDYIRKPFFPQLVKRRVENVVELMRYQNALETLITEKSDTLNKINGVIMDVLTSVLKTKTQETEAHMQRIRLYTKALLDYIYQYNDDNYNLTAEGIDTISTAAGLHDIGEMMIPEPLAKKEDDLTERERTIWKQHTVKGSKLATSLANSENESYIKYCTEISRSHHENWDGSGFPDSLSGDAIPLSAQAVGIAHYYDDLMETKNYTHEQAVRKIQEMEYSLFSPVLVEAFKLIEDEIDRIRRENTKV